MHFSCDIQTESLGVMAHWLRPNKVVPEGTQKPAKKPLAQKLKTWIASLTDVLMRKKSGCPLVDENNNFVRGHRLSQGVRGFLYAPNAPWGDDAEVADPDWIDDDAGGVAVEVEVQVLVENDPDDYFEIIIQEPEAEPEEEDNGCSWLVELYAN